MHGSSVYSDEVKSHQDLDIYFIFKEENYEALRNFKEILKEFCKGQSFGDNEVYYSIAGAGRGAIEKYVSDKKQIFRFEIFIDNQKDFEMDWKNNISFPHYLCKNYFVLFGKDVKNYLDYVGDIENKAFLFSGFDKFQWTISSVFEKDFEEFFLESSILESVFFDLDLLFLNYGLKERRKLQMINLFEENFQKMFKKYKLFLRNVLALRISEKKVLSSERFFNIYLNFHNEIMGEINGRIRKS